MKLAAVGSNCVDFYQNVEGGKAYPGGGPVNMAVYTVRLGGEASYIGPVGNDDFGALMRRAVAEKGVDVSHLSVREGKTAVTQVSLIDGERVFGDYDEGVLSDYVLSEDDLSFICTHDMVICDLWGKVEGQFCELKRRGMQTAFDCATRPEDEAAQTAMPFTDVLFFSSDGGDTGALREQMRDYHARGPRPALTESASTASASSPAKSSSTRWARATAISPGSSSALSRDCRWRTVWQRAQQTLP